MPPSTSFSVGSATTGGQPPNSPFTVHSTLHPNCWRPSMRSEMGRSRMRGVPSNVKDVPSTAATAATTAANGRMAVPALPRNKSFPGAFNDPVEVTLTAESPRSFTFTPMASKASSILSVSSDANKFSTTVSPSHSAAKSSARFDSDLDPGSRTTPPTLAMGSTTRESTAWSVVPLRRGVCSGGGVRSNAAAPARQAKLSARRAIGLVAACALARGCVL